jgi:hypothetical protein
MTFSYVNVNHVMTFSYEKNVNQSALNIHFDPKHSIHISIYNDYDYGGLMPLSTIFQFHYGSQSYWW